MRKFAALLTVLSLLCPVTPVQATDNPHKDHVAVRVVACGSQRSVRVATSPADLCAEVRVAPHPEHRYLVVSWDYADANPLADMLAQAKDANDPLAEPDEQDGAVGSTEDDLDGEQERVRPRPQGHVMAGLKHGTYEVTARVYRDPSRRSVSCSGRASVMVR